MLNIWVQCLSVSNSLMGMSYTIPVALTSNISCYPWFRTVVSRFLQIVRSLITEMSSLSPSYLDALLSSHYLSLEVPTQHRDSNSSLFSLLKNRHISNCSHESVYCRKRAFHLSFQRRQNFWSHDMLGHYGSVQSINLSPDERLLASGGEDGRLLVWDIQQSLRCSDVTQDTGTACTELVSMNPLQFYSVAFGAGGDQVLIVLVPVSH